MKTLLLVLTFSLCGNVYSQSTLSPKEFKPIEVYHSEDLIIIQISDNAFLHTSYLQTNDFGNVPCNGMIVRNSNEVVVFDTPPNIKTIEIEGGHISPLEKPTIVLSVIKDFIK